MEDLIAVMGHNQVHNVSHPPLVNNHQSHNRGIFHNISKFQKLNPPQFDGRQDPMVTEECIM